MSSNILEVSRYSAAALLLAVCMSACVQTPGRSVHLHPKTAVVSVSDLQGAVRELSHCGARLSSTPTGIWLPSRATVDSLDRTVRDALAETLESVPELKAEDYYIQYVGLTMGDGAVILVNGVHEVAARVYFPSQWQVRLMVICDIGRAGFRSEYDVSARHLRGLQFSESY